mgnify:CR=1 FL=1|tara:strand:+ start:491 stop:931 length:441 start_codon:yes stop_codon:yes gene_type:complete
MKKRGLFTKKATTYLVYFVMFEIFLIGVVALGLGSFLVSVKENTALERNYLSRDLALTTTVIGFSPSEIDYIYETPKFPLTQFNYEWNNNEVLIYKTDSYKTNFQYMSKNIIKDPKLIYPEKIIIQKQIIENDKTKEIEEKLIIKK